MEQHNSSEQGFANFKDIVSEQVCSGCGACSFVNNTKIDMLANRFGQLIPVITEEISAKEEEILNKVCPFSASSHDKHIELGQFENKSLYVGDYINAFAAYVNESNYRELGSSGGMGTWINEQFLNNSIVDSIIHVRESNNKTILFEYSISSTPAELALGSSSKYYPVTMDKVLHFVLGVEGTVAFIAVPCFVRALRNLQVEYPILKTKIKFIGSLYCGHLKSANYSSYIADSIKFNAGSLTKIDYRVKTDSRVASDYLTEVTFNKTALRKANRDIPGTNWGLGLFKYKSCDYCEDVCGELADYSIGDAWLPKYELDGKGTNVLVIRNPLISEIIEKAFKEKKISIFELSENELYDCQSGGYRHKRDGIHLRNQIRRIFFKKAIKTRFQKRTNIGFSKSAIYIIRILSRSYSDLYPLFKKNQLTFDIYQFGIKIFCKVMGLFHKLDKKRNA